MQKDVSEHIEFTDEEFEVAFHAPFVPNSVMAFAACWHSWHMCVPCGGI